MVANSCPTTGPLHMLPLCSNAIPHPQTHLITPFYPSSAFLVCRDRSVDPDLAPANLEDTSNLRLCVID